MKKKIIEIVIWPLEKLYLFRIDRCFLLPSECRRLMAAHTAKLQSEFQDLRHKFKEGVLQLAKVKAKSTSVQYEVKIYVNRAALETTAGENAAVAEISLAIAKQLVERHKRAIEREKENVVDAKRKCIYCGKGFSKKEYYSRTDIVMEKGEQVSHYKCWKEKNLVS